MDFGNRHAPVVYFIRDTGSDLIKIGYTIDLRNRLACIQCYACSGMAEVLGYVPGGYEEEQSLHQRFAADRFEGEWFRPSPALLGYVASEAVDYTPPPSKNLGFRSYRNKETIPGQVPVPLADAIRERAFRERRSLSEVTTEIVCIGMSRDPKTFGIEPGRGRRKPVETASAP
jgi:hypothetical protein